MDKITEGKRKARELTKVLGHILPRFESCLQGAYHSSYCRKCLALAYVEPTANGYSITGDFLSQKCQPWQTKYK